MNNKVIPHIMSCRITSEYHQPGCNALESIYWLPPPPPT